MNILVIAEKPSLARDIAAALPGSTPMQTKDYIKKGEYTITWLFGHILGLKDPEEYDPKYADRDDISLLPIYFPFWELSVPKDDVNGTKQERLDLIGELLDDADMVIHAGDVDEEGQLLVDEVLRWHRNSKPVYRLSTANTTVPALQKAMKNLEDNEKFENRGWSAYARSVADFVVGINLTRYFSAINGVLLPVGRVKMPTLGLVIQRDLIREQFKEVTYYNITAKATLAGEVVNVSYQKDKNLPEDERRVLSLAEANDIIADAAGNPNREGVVEKSIVNELPPLPFNLVELQSFASKHFGYSPKRTLDITQNLRMKYKAITYNRSNCQYLSSEQFAEAPGVIQSTLENIGRTDYSPYIDFSEEHKSAAFNDSLITEHTAIIPSGQKVELSLLTPDERNIYVAIANRYVIQFLPPCKKEKTTLAIDMGENNAFVASTAKVLSYGFRDFVRASLPMHTNLDNIQPGTYDTTLSDFASDEKKTTPPAAYTKASLNKDMTRIAKYVEDEEVKKLLRAKDKGKKGENGSIGTSATRATIIDELVGAGYLIEDSSKHLTSSPMGREFYRILPDEFKYADLTARWWVMQEDIKEGKLKPEDLTETVLASVRDVLSREYPPIDKSLMSDLNGAVVGKCPKCGSEIHTFKSRGVEGYKCSNPQCNVMIWKSPAGALFQNVTLTEDKVSKLLKGESIKEDQLYSEKKKSTFSGTLTLVLDEESKYGVRIQIAMAGREVLGTCPSCNGEIVEGKRGYGCSNYRDGCKFVIWKTGVAGSLLSKTNITASMVKKLLAGESVPVDTLYSKTKDSQFSGNLKVGFSEQYGWGIQVDFPEFGEEVGTCPRCGGKVIETPSSFACENRKTGCRFVIWKKAKGGVFMHHNITKSEANLLLAGKTIVIGNLWSAAKKKTFSGSVYLDDSNLSDYGPELKFNFNDVSRPSRKRR